MIDPKIDPARRVEQRLAALLDGRLDERERAEVLRELEADDELRAVYADAVAIEAELTAAPASGDVQVRPFRRETVRSRWRGGRGLLLAAGLAGIAFVPWVALRSRGDVGEPYALVRQLDVGAPAELPPAPWGATRGGAAQVSERGRAVRLGAGLVDLELAIAARDSGMRRLAASSIATLATVNEPLAGAPVDVYRDIAAGEPDAVRGRAVRREAWKALSGAAGEEPMRLGAWLRAARVAVVRRDAEFFGTREARRVLDATSPAADDEERRAMQQVRAAARAGSPDWAALAAALDQALRLAGR